MRGGRDSGAAKSFLPAAGPSPAQRETVAPSAGVPSPFVSESTCIYYAMILQIMQHLSAPRTPCRASAKLSRSPPPCQTPRARFKLSAGSKSPNNSRRSWRIQRRSSAPKPPPRLPSAIDFLTFGKRTSSWLVDRESQLDDKGYFSYLYCKT